MSGGGDASSKLAPALPSWMEALRHRAGPMLRAADDLQRWLGPAPFPEGHEGIKRLGALVDAFVFDPSFDDAADSRFVEGAGAMLGLLLLAHLGGAGHREQEGHHRILLGKYGTFDPFGAVDASLDAPRPAAELVRQIHLAEAEARGTGPFAKMQRALDASLLRVGANRSVGARFEHHAILDDGTELDLRRFASLLDEPETLEAALDKLLSALAGVAPRIEWEEASSRLLPRLVSKGFVDDLRRERGVEVAFESFASELGVCLVLAFEGRSRFLRNDEESTLLNDGFVPRERAIARLEALISSMRWRSELVAGISCLLASRGDGLASSMILSRALRMKLIEDLGPDVVVAIPHRDRLLVARAPSDERAFAEAIADEFRRAPHGVSPLLYRLNEAGLEAYR